MSKGHDQLSKTYEILMDTLTMVSSKYKVLDDEEIEIFLEELEGDYYSFFDRHAIIPLRDAGLIDQSQFEQIINLKAAIYNMEANYWTREAFITHKEWIAIHEIADNLLNAITLNK